MAASLAVRVKITGVTELVKEFDVLPEEVKGNVVEEVTRLTHELYGRVRARAGGEVLQVKSGKLLASLRERISIKKYGVRGTVRSTLGRRAGFLEFGGHAKARDIMPDKATALHFLKGGAEIFAGLVHHPGPTITPHSYLLSSLEAMETEISEALGKAATVRG
jgi:hypothetical protein